MSTSEFYQAAPRLDNQYEADRLLKGYLAWRLPAPMLGEVEPELRQFGARVAGDIAVLGRLAESNPPRLVRYDPWGRRIDDIVVSDAWRELDRISAVEGLVAIAYERANGALSRVHQMAKLYLFHPSSSTYSCPLAMGDGAARFLEVFGDERTRAAFEHLTSRDPARFWTSGQWMTERTGGSDVSGTSTIASRGDSKPAAGDGDCYRLFGTKWFTSATTSQMAIALARIDGAPAGGRGLSAFLIELRDADGALCGIRVNRLKDKLGTRALPTAELTLDGAPALLVGGAGDGVRKIASMFNVTRVYNAVAAVAGMRRAVALAQDYAARRVAFGKPLVDQPLHRETLLQLDTVTRACFLLAFQAVELLGKEECGTATERELGVLRVLTPVAKLYTAKHAVRMASEAVEAFGGAGYIEDTGIPQLLRDAQVLPIWEGTTNVLSLDVLRAIERTDAWTAWRTDIAERLDDIDAPTFSSAVEQIRSRIDALARLLETARNAGTLEATARRVAFGIAHATAAVRLVEYAVWCATNPAGSRDAAAAAEAVRRWLAPFDPGLSFG
jgi:putative acyl-CoA dehydrogenase